MYLYFDRTGVLKEIINDEALRQGNYGINKMYIYIENRNYSSIDVSYANPEGTIIGPQNHNTFTNPDADTPAENCYIPWNPKRDLKYFKYWTPYKFLIIDLEATTTELNDTEVALGPGPLDVPGIVHCSLSANLETSDILQLGDVNFLVQASEGLNNEIAPEHYLSLSNYLYLRSELDGKLSSDGGTLNQDSSISVETSDATKKKSILDGNGLELYTYAVGGVGTLKHTFYKAGEIYNYPASLTLPQTSGTLALVSQLNTKQKKLYKHEVWLRDDDSTTTLQVNIINSSEDELTWIQVWNYIASGLCTYNHINGLDLTDDEFTIRELSALNVGIPSSPKIYLCSINITNQDTLTREVVELEAIDEQFSYELE